MREQTKMRDLCIFKNKVRLSDTLVLHEDDMKGYNSWFLTEYHGVDKVVFRGSADRLNELDSEEFLQFCYYKPGSIVISKFKISKGLYDMYLGKIGNPRNILITFSTKDAC